MGSTSGTHLHSTEEHRGSSLRKPMTLKRGHLRLAVEPDGSVRFLESLAEKRLLFGRDQVSVYKEKGGMVLQAQRLDWRVRFTPSQVSISASAWDSIEVSQRVGILPSPAEGYFRELSLRNLGASPAKLRIINLHDPTAAHFRDGQFAWGSLGVNAFNRSTHVAMDEVSSPPSARIIGSRPGPRLICLTTDAGVAAELLSAGELPEQTAGMSGQVLVMAQYDSEIPPGGSVELSVLVLYDPSRLEAALSTFGRLSETDLNGDEPEFCVSTSSREVTAAARWAVATLEGAEYEADLLDRYEVLKTLAYVDPDSTKAIVRSATSSLSKDGSAGHSLDPKRPGVLETATLLEGVCVAGLLSNERRYSRSAFSSARKLAAFLCSSFRGGKLIADASLPQGWRRRIGKGYPSGEIPELSLSAAAALAKAATLASRLGKQEEAAKWTESSRVLVRSVRERMVDDNGRLALCREGDRLRSEETVDQAVACYRLSPGRDIESHVVRRLLEKDFECGWGPRTIPTTNRTYFNPSYGEGQLGGYWTRAALAHAVAAYRGGLPGIGSIELESISRLPSVESPGTGMAPGEFPYWVDLRRREAHGPGSDPVSASRFLEALTGCELGLQVGSDGLEIEPSQLSRLRWLLMSGVFAGERTSVFLGRTEGSSYVFVGIPDCKLERGWRFRGSGQVSVEDRAASGATFFSPGQTVCVGNAADSNVKTKVSFEPRDPSLSRHLSARLQKLEAESGTWSDAGPIRVLSKMSFDLSLGPREWGAFRVSTGS